MRLGDRIPGIAIYFCFARLDIILPLTYNCGQIYGERIFGK